MTDYQARIDKSIETFKREAQVIADDCYRAVIAPYLKAHSMVWIGAEYNEHGFRKANGKTVDWMSIAPEIQLLWDMPYTSNEWDSEGYYYHYLREFWPIGDDYDN